MECDAVTNFFHLLESQIQDFEWYYNVSIVTMVPLNYHILDVQCVSQYATQDLQETNVGQYIYKIQQCFS